MYHTIVNAGILTTWPVGDTKTPVKGVSTGSQRETITEEDPTTGGERVESRLSTLVERTHASMRTKKTTDTIHHAPAREGALDFGMLYEKFSRPLHSYIYRLLGSHEDADDVTQEVFTRAYLAWNDLYDRDNLSPWLYRIATNLCVDHLRRRKRISWWPLIHIRRGEDAATGREEDMSYLPPDSGGIPEVGEREHIHRTLANMPRDYAIALVLSAAQGVPYQEIGSILGISPNAAATRISRAKRMFMEAYQRFNDDDAGKQEECV